MARYVDGFVFAVPKNKVDEYRKVARKAGKIWKEHGALSTSNASATMCQRGRSPTSR